MSEPRDRERLAEREEPGSSLAERVRRLMPELTSDLVRLARIPSIAFPGFPEAPLLEAHDVVAGLVRDAGVQRVATLSLADTAPVIIGDIPGPDGAPTVLLYAKVTVPAITTSRSPARAGRLTGRPDPPPQSETVMRTFPTAAPSTAS